MLREKYCIKLQQQKIVNFLKSIREKLVQFQKITTLDFKKLEKKKDVFLVFVRNFNKQKNTYYFNINKIKIAFVFY